MKIGNNSIVSAILSTMCTFCSNWSTHNKNFIIPMKVILFGSVLLTMFATPLFAANYYVKSGGSVGSGISWDNAYNALPSSLVRGDIYYIAGGTYSGRTFNTATSGTSVITIKGATVADHGTDNGWSSSYSVENTRATWTSAIRFDTSYWVWDGSVGSLTENTTAYGFILSSMTYPVYIGTSGTSNITISHVYAKSPTADVEREFLSTATTASNNNNITVSHSFLDGWQNGMSGNGAGTADNWVFEYNLAYNMYSSSAHHGEWINPNGPVFSGFIARYNIFKGSPGGTGTIVANNSNNTGAKIYGNVFNDLHNGNGIITGTSVAQLINAVVYNNTFLNCSGGNPIGGTGQGSGNLAYNNLIYNSAAGLGGGFTSDYNAYFSTTGSPSETHKQTGSSNPFVNSAGGDYHLISATTAGKALPSPYNTDMNGNTRGADGVWDRGAFEFTSGGRIPSPPSIMGITK